MHMNIKGKCIYICVCASQTMNKYDWIKYGQYLLGLLVHQVCLLDRWKEKCKFIIFIFCFCFFFFFSIIDLSLGSCGFFFFVIHHREQFGLLAVKKKKKKRSLPSRNTINKCILFGHLTSINQVTNKVLLLNG